jgi:hypothetical protein
MSGPEPASAPGRYPFPAPPTYAGPTRERWIWTAVVVGIGALIFGVLLVSWIGGAPQGPQQVGVADVLSSGTAPSARFDSHQIQIAGWYAAATTGCSGDDGGADSSVSWLQRTCPVRVLLAQEPAGPVTAAQLLRDGLRLAAPNGEPFPPPAPTGSGTAGQEQLVFTGHFDDAAAAKCVPDREDQCRNTFVVSGYTGLIR